MRVIDATFWADVESCLCESLMPIIQGLVPFGSTICTDGLILNGYGYHRVLPHENEFARSKSHGNSIEKTPVNFSHGRSGRIATEKNNELLQY